MIILEADNNLHSIYNKSLC